MVNRQLRTCWATPASARLVTELVEAPVSAPGAGEVTVAMLAVPIHGSFWLATHPSAQHPRQREFMQSGGFVFGNGGVGRVVATGAATARTAAGDVVSVMGHLPCSHHCPTCHDLGRVTECPFNEGRIVGHGKGAPDGTFASYCTLPEVAVEVCFRGGQNPPPEEVTPFMLGFLLADVRNALTRDADSLQRRRVLLIGAGYSGHFAAWLLLRRNPHTRILVADLDPDRVASVTALDPSRIDGVVLDRRSAGLNDDAAMARQGQTLALAVDQAFGRNGPDLIFDASSGNSIPLWLNTQILRPGAHAITFGFGSAAAELHPDVVQLSGFSLRTSRGVGTFENRQAAIRALHAGAAAMVRSVLLPRAAKLSGLNEALTFILARHRGDVAAAAGRPAWIDLTAAARGSDGPA